tara:strand:+ start:135 stop:1010 length:876 start_codon:yes stop_codon:yes gene_type:complete
MSRNDSRHGGENTSPGDANFPVTEVEDTTNNSTQPLSFSVPTEQVELPSQGRYYPENHPLHKAETIEIKFMTAKEEDILTSPSLLKKNLTMERLLRSVIINKMIDPQHLLIGDRNAILVATRKTGYGEDYEVKTSCPSCLAPNEWSTNLDEVKVVKGGVASAEGYEVSDNENGTFDVVLPKSKVTVTVKLLTGRDEKEIAARAQKRKKHKLEENNLTEQLKAMIISVNGTRNFKDVENFVNFVPAFDSKYLRNAYAKIMPNIDMSHDFECSSCDWEGTMEVPLTAEFFWPK